MTIVAIDGFIAFCENEMTLVDGSDLTLLDSFKLWAESLLSWFYFEKVTKFVPDENWSQRSIRSGRCQKALGQQAIPYRRARCRQVYVHGLYPRLLPDY